MNKLLKNMKKAVSIMLVMSMIFTSHAFVTFAEGVNEATETETTELVGANSVSPEEETTVEEEETTVGEASSFPEDETTVGEEEITVGETSSFPEEENIDSRGELANPEADEETSAETTDYAEEPEEEETETVVEEETETTVGEATSFPEEETTIEEEETTVSEEETKVNDDIYGDDPKYLDYIDIASYTIKTYYVGDKYDTSNLKIKAYYTDGSYEIVPYDEGNKSKFSFSPDCVNNPFTASTTDENPYELTITYDDGTNDPFVTQAFQVHAAPTPTEKKFCIKYFNITGTNWTSIASREEVHNIINNPIVKEFTSSTDTSEVAAAIGTLGYTNGFKKLTKDEYDNYTGIGAATHTSDEEIYNITKENGIFDQWKLSPTETVYYGVNYYYYDAELNYAENHSSGTWEIYDNTFDWNTDLSPHELVAFHNNDAEEAIVLPQVTVKGSDTYKMRNTSTGDIQYIWTWALQPDGMQERSFGDTENAWPFKPETKTLTLYAQWYGDTPTTTYTVKYNQDLPTGYTLSGGMTWYTDSTTTDLTGNPIILKGSADMTCEDTSGNTRTLQSWNTQIEHKGNTFNFGDTFNDSQYFDPDPTCTLYAVWSDPIPPAPTPVTTDWYWYLDGTHMHYTATDGAGRTKVTFRDGYGVDYGSTDVTSVTETSFDDTIAPDNLQGLFRNFTNLEKINNFTKLNTSNATNMSRMFNGCSKITSLNVSHFNTSKVTDMSQMFQSCRELTSLDVSKFDTQNVTNMKFMFDNLRVATSIKLSSKFVTNKVTTMLNMFQMCQKISSLDLTSFDVSSLTQADSMFASCIELTTIKTSSTLDFSSVSSSDEMFKYCDKLKGGQGTTYDASHIDKEYAHVDGGTSNPGYFTASGGPTPPGPTPPGPTPPSPGGGGTGGGTGGGSSDPTHGPLGDISQNPEYGGVYTENKIPQSELVTNNALAVELLSIPENANRGYSNARDVNGNTGYGQWLKIPNTHTWYFLSGSFTNTTETVGFLSNGWFNLGWKGKDEWYYFDASGVMQIGWRQEGNYIYYLEEDFSNNWYGKVVTGKKVINGVEYTFASDGKLIP